MFMNLRRRGQRFALDAFLCMAVVIGTQMQTAAQSAPARRHKNDIKEFGKWPKGSSPEEIGRRVAEHFAAGPHTNFGRSTPPKLITYPETCTWYGSLTFAQLSGDKDLTAKLVNRFEPLFSTDSNLIPVPKNVDSTVFAAVPFELYIETKQEKYLDVGKSMADKQWEDTTSDGISKQARYWIDDMYMMTMAQLQAYRATGDQKYLDRAALAMTAYLDK